MEILTLSLRALLFLCLVAGAKALEVNHGDLSAVTSLLDQLQDPIKSQKAAEDLIKLGKSDPAVATVLNDRIPEMIRHQSTSVIHAFVWGNEVLIAGKLKMTELVPLLAAKIEPCSTQLLINIGDNASFINRPAVEALIDIGSPSTSPMAGTLTHGDVTQREEAAYVLGHIGTPNARQALESALPKEADSAVRNYIQDALSLRPAPQQPSGVKPK